MPILSKGNTFADGDQVTSAKLNNLVDNASFVAGGSGTTDDATLEVNGSGRLQVKTIQTGNIANYAITTTKIANSTGSSDGVTTAKIADNAVTTAKIANSTGSSDGVTTAKIADDAVTQAKIADAAVGTAQLIDANITAAKLNGAQTGSAPIYGVRAWVNFDATKDSAGSVSSANTNRLIRSQGNVSSVNKSSTGTYRVTFTTAMPDANYATITGSDANSPHKIAGVISQTSTYVDIAYSQINTSTARVDPDWGQVIIIG